jgi:hypothetical protein
VSVVLGTATAGTTSMGTRNFNRELELGNRPLIANLPTVTNALEGQTLAYSVCVVLRSVSLFKCYNDMLRTLGTELKVVDANRHFARFG